MSTRLNNPNNVTKSTMSNADLRDALMKYENKLKLKPNAIDVASLIDAAFLKSHDIISEGHTVLFKTESNFLSQSIQPVTKEGALSSSTVIDAVGSYDRVDVTGGDASSRLVFSKQMCTNEYIIRLKIKVDAVYTSPIVGLGIVDVPNGTYANWTAGSFLTQANLLTGAVTSTIDLSEMVVVSDNSLGTVTSGDILTITFTSNYLKYKEFMVLNEDVSGGMTSRRALIDAHTKNKDPMATHFTPAIILADGKYTILGFEFIATTPLHPKIAIVGDSLGSGFRLFGGKSLGDSIRAKIPYNVFRAAGGSCLLAGMQACQHEVLKLRPQYVLIAHSLDGITYGKANPAGGATYTTFVAALAKYVAGIRAIGAKPMFFKNKQSYILMTQQAADNWNAMIASEYPNDLIVDITDITYTYDGTTFQYDESTYDKIAQKVVAVMKADGGL